MRRKKPLLATVWLMIAIGALLTTGHSQSEEVPLLRQVSTGQFTDRLHGFSVRVPQGWVVKAYNNFVRIYDEDALCFVVLRVARYDGNLHRVAQAWLSEHKAMMSDSVQPRFAFKKFPQGILIVGEGLSYPFALHPMMAVNFGLLRQAPPRDYREVTAILPGKKTALVVSLLFPVGTEKAKWDTMMNIVRSFQFLPPSKMIPWRRETIRDPEIGKEAGSIHVPEGFEYQGAIIRQGTKRMPRISLRKGDFMFRQDLIDINSMVLQTAFGGNATTVITINGQSATLSEPAFIQSAEEVIQLILGLWQEETGKEWELKERVDLPKTAMEKWMEQQELQMMAQVAQVYQRALKREGLKFAISAQSGQLIRQAVINGFLLISQQPDPIAASQDCSLSIMVSFYQFPKDRADEAAGIFTGIMSSLYLSPEAALSALERFIRENQELNRMVQQMLNEQREFNTRMAKAWTNALSDQTYVKDPETSEIFRVHKRVWETGEFWRDSVWGDILGGVERGSELEKLLKEKGWRQLKQSLEGFPEQW
jgi:hypothetical protein